MRVAENIKYVKTTTLSEKQNLVGKPYLIPLTDYETAFETLDKYQNRHDAVMINGKVLYRNDNKSMPLKEFNN